MQLRFLLYTTAQSFEKGIIPSAPGSPKKSTIYSEKICSISKYLHSHPPGKILLITFLLKPIGQCENGIFTFEKVTGHFLRSARQEMLNSRGKLSVSSSRPGDSVGGGITVDCGRACLEMGADCPAYSVDYSQVCFNNLLQCLLNSLGCLG